MVEKQYLVRDFLWFRKKGDAFEWGVLDQSYVSKPEDFKEFFDDFAKIYVNDKDEIISDKATYRLVKGAHVLVNVTNSGCSLSALIEQDGVLSPIEPLPISYDELKELPSVISDYFDTGVVKVLNGLSRDQNLDDAGLAFEGNIGLIDSRFKKASQSLLEFDVFDKPKEPYGNTDGVEEESNNEEQPKSPVVKDVSLVEVKEPLPGDLSDLAKEMKDFLGTRVREKNDRFIS